MEMMSLMILTCALFCMGLAIALHRHTAGRPWRSPFGFGDAIAAGLTLWIFTLIMALCGSYLLAGTICIMLALMLWICNEAKKKALRGEPLVFSDVSLLMQACRFPSMYLPFLPMLWLLVGLLAGAGLICLL